MFLCDRNKLGKLGIPRISGLEEIDRLITDIELDETWRAEFEKNDVELIVV